MDQARLPPAGPAPLPAGWTEHKAPTGHVYYYNKGLNKSTYTRPTASQSPVPAIVPQPVPEQFIPSYSAGQFAGGYAATQFQAPLNVRPSQPARDRKPLPHRQRDNDRPKHIYKIPGCAPWVLVRTKYGRRFVHNTESKESFWKFPEDVMKGVVEFDRRERESQERRDRGEPGDVEADDDGRNGEASQVVPVQEDQEQDEDEYEEIEVTDSEAEEDQGGPSKRQRIEEPVEDDGPVEFTEEDIAYQLELQAMEGNGMGEYIEGEGEGEGEGYYGDEPPLGDEDAQGLFQDLLNDYKISPYKPWDAIIDEGTIIDDERYTALPNMKSRRECFDLWSRAKIQELREKREREAKQDPKIAYFQLLDDHASSKLFWPEFKRKYRKEAAMRDVKLGDRDREKWYRDLAKRLALPRDTLKKDFSALLKSLPLAVLNRDTSLEALPARLLTDLRFISLPPKIRIPLLEAYLATLPAAPESDGDEADAAARIAEREQREKRERALRERREKVEAAQRQGQRDQRVARERLREREEELDAALRVGKQGLRAHFQSGDAMAEDIG